MLGELAGVAKQVKKALLQLGAVGVERSGIVRIDDVEPVSAGGRERRNDRAHLLDQRLEIDLFEIEVHLARLDLRQVENVVDQIQQMPPGVADLREVGHELVETFVLGHFLQHLAVADHGIKRGAQLVAHIGEEGRFVLARRFQLLIQRAQLLAGAVDVGGERAELVVIGDGNALGEIALGDAAEPGIDFADRSDQ